MILDMLICYPTAAADAAPELRAAAYAGQLERFPAWAIGDAIATCAREHCPSAGKLVAECESIMTPWVAHQAQVKKLLGARPIEPDDSDRLKVGEGLRDLTEEIRTNAAADAAKGDGWRKLPPAQWPQDVAERALDEAAAARGDLPAMRISPNLRAVLNAQNEARGEPILPVPDDELDEYARRVCR